MSALHIPVMQWAKPILPSCHGVSAILQCKGLPRPQQLQTVLSMTPYKYNAQKIQYNACKTYGAQPSMHVLAGVCVRKVINLNAC